MCCLAKQNLNSLREHPSNFKDTFDFVTRILSSKPGPNHMVSFDVKSLFTNIPSDFVIDQILEKSFPDKKGLFHGLTHSQFKKLLIWTTKKTTLQFNNRYFKQINGTAMGSPLAPLLLDVCINWLIDQSQKSEPSLCNFTDTLMTALLHLKNAPTLPNFTNILTLFTQTYNLPMNWLRTTNWLSWMYGLAIQMENWP